MDAEKHERITRYLTSREKERDLTLAILKVLLTHACVPRRRQRVTVVTLALEGSVHVDAVSVGAHSRVLTLVVI